MAKPKTLRRKYDPLPLSEAALDCIERVARARHGAPYTPEILARAVAALSHAYTRDRTALTRIAESPDSALARIAFFLARDLPKVFGPLDELAAAGVRFEAERVRVLDVGAGYGATSLGVARWLRLRGSNVRGLDVVALEQNAAALRGFSELAQSLAGLDTELAPIRVEARNADVRDTRLGGAYDLVLFGFVLNELYVELAPEERARRRAELLIAASERLGPTGALIVLEPALKETTRELMQVRDVIAAQGRAPYVIAPCLHAQACPMLPSERDWCHQELPYALPPALADIARRAQLRYEGLSYASLVLANTARASDASANEHVVRIVSDRLESKGKLELFGCSAAGYTRFTQLTRDERAHNHAFTCAARSAILAIDDASHESTRIGPDTRVTRRGP